MVWQDCFFGRRDIRIRAACGFQRLAYEMNARYASKDDWSRKHHGP